MNIKTISINKLKPYDQNPRKNDDAVEYVMNSIKEFGWQVPIVIDKNNVIVCGHTRYKAARRLGIDKVPVLMADDLTEEQITAYRLVDNKTQELSKWDFSKLIAELKDLLGEIDMSLVGFTTKTEEDEKITSAATQKLDAGEELDLSDFEDETFNQICPCCGFKFNE